MVKLITQVLFVSLIVFTVVAVLFPSIGEPLEQLSMGSATAGVFDLLLLTIATLVALKFFTAPGREICTSNRIILWSIIVYVVLQITVVVPLALLTYDNKVDVTYHAVQPRLSLLLVPFIYWFVLRSFSLRRVVELTTAAGVIVALVAVVSFVRDGPRYLLEGGALRLRQLYGSASLLLGWSLLERLLLHPATAGGLGLLFIPMAGILLTNHRSAYLALAAAFVTYAALEPASRRRWHVPAAVIALTVITVTVVGGPLMRQATHSFDTVMDPDSANATMRLERWGDGLDYFTSHPFGDNVFNARIHLVTFYGDSYAGHNFVVEMLDYEGLPGVFFWILLMAQIGIVGWRIHMRSPVARFALVYLVFYFAYSFFNANFYLNNTVVLPMLAIAIVMHENRRLAQSRKALYRRPTVSLETAAPESEEPASQLR